MTDKQKRAIIGRAPGKTFCQGCGEEISPEAEVLSDVEYVKTKRGDNWFFHTKCLDKVWKRKIVWE